MKRFIFVGLLFCASFAHAGGDVFSANGAFSGGGGFFETDSFTQSVFEKNCGRKGEGYACPQCEDQLNQQFTELMNKYTQTPVNSGSRWADGEQKDGIRLKPGTTAEDFIADTIKLMRKANPLGGGKVNFIPIGRSESLHDTSVGNPRILLKSPDSELWVSYNTDPKSYAYQKVEIMRWDGKAGKYFFQELDFSNPPDGHHANMSGKVCATCHKEPARPIWDTYRAWPGVLHPRDDMVEAENPDEGGQPDAAARDYLRFLRRIAAAKENPNGQDRRLAGLEIPTSFSGSPKEQIDQIEAQVKQKGWYRVPSFPNPRDGKNWDTKTAMYAGPSHLAFDQMLGQQMCQVATQLQASKPAFERLKYAITGILKCIPTGEINQDILRKFLPVDYATQSDLYFQNPDHRPTADGGTEPMPRAPWVGTTAANQKKLLALPMLFRNTTSWQSKEAAHKSDLERYYLIEVLESIEKLDAVSAQNQARFIAEDKQARAQPGFHAISDPGGVKGVAEASPGTIASLRYILEPLGFPVETWSTSRGDAVSLGRSYGFSDQFLPFLKNQKIFEDTFHAASGNSLSEKCDDLAKKSAKALDHKFFEIRANVTRDIRGPKKETQDENKRQTKSTVK
jgi:hypothetical protein